jgi:hypothetical protein
MTLTLDPDRFLAEKIEKIPANPAWPSSDAINRLAKALNESGTKLDLLPAGAQAFSAAIKSAITPPEPAFVSILKKHGDDLFFGGAITGLVSAGFLWAGRQFQFPWLAEYATYPFAVGNSLTGLIAFLQSCENIREKMTLKRRLKIATPLLDAAIKTPALVEETAEHLLRCAARAERLGDPKLIPQNLLNDALSALSTHFKGRQDGRFLIHEESQHHLLKLASSLEPADQQLAQTAAKILAYTLLVEKIEADLAQKAASATAYCAQQKLKNKKAGPPSNQLISVPAGQAELFKLLALPELFNPQPPSTRSPALRRNLAAFSAVVNQPPT